MFHLPPETVKLLYQAQQLKMRGRLRLDISAGCFPADATRPLDLACAQRAAGERVVQMLKGCALDAGIVSGVSVPFQPNAVPPPPDRHNRLRVMPDSQHFDAFVVKRLDDVFGLDLENPSYATALAHLAEDFFTWASREPEAHETYGFQTERNQVFIRCEPLRAAFAPLEPAAPGQDADQGSA
jgi:hypothetical protein